MLQTHFENELFNSLPNIYSNNRSRSDFITTDRPDSTQLVDLHVYIIPKSVWKIVQHLAENQAIDDAISAGFVRVSPDLKLQDLREAIEKLCGTENYFPRDFIFLRSVGRCMTRVKPTQENELKVKNYRPPQTFAPEIYLLEGRHEDYSQTPSASPALSSASYVFGNRNQQRLNLDDIGRVPSRHSHQRSIPTERYDLSKMNTSDILSRLPSSGRKSWTKSTQISSNRSSPKRKFNGSVSLSRLSVVTSIPSRDLAKVRDEQERLRRRQAALERMRRAAEEKKVNSEQEKERRRRRQEKSQSEREEEERRRQRRQEKAEADRRRLEQVEAATKIQASFRGFKDRQAFKEHQSHALKTNSRISSSKTDTTLKKSVQTNEEKIDINDDELSDGSQILSRSSSIGSTSDVDSNLSRPETRTINKEPRESLDSNSSSLLSMKTERKIQSNLSSHSKTEDIIDSPKPNIDDDNTRSTTVTKIRHPEENSLPISTPDINDDFLLKRTGLERREAEAKRRRQPEEEKRKARELEEQRRRELAKRQQREDPESLRTLLQELHTRRVDLEKIRDEVIKHLKYIHSRITLRRKEARDMWKKKYFHEKKKTPSTDDRATQLKIDLDQIHNKIVQTMDNECKHSAQMGYLKEAEAGNFILQVTRIQHDLQDIRHQVDQAKLRLTTDIKLRNQAETECRTLKHELNQAKMNLSHIKKRAEV